tara:strand:+ start:128 stop:823 length:696 start_codon:yes stop_codon:yes gene_type:complete
MTFETFNIFPTTLYVGKMLDHEKYKEEFYKVYPRYDYEETDIDNTVSENLGKPFIHLEDSLDTLFNEIAIHAKKYVCEVLEYKDIFNYVITKSWLSRARRSDNEIRWHIHSTSHISFVYYLSTPSNSHAVEFSNTCSKNDLFQAMNAEDTDEPERNIVNNFNALNSPAFYMQPIEGHLILFPSSLSHHTRFLGGEFQGERLGIVGDMSLILKEDQLHYSTGYIDNKYWKKY